LLLAHKAKINAKNKDGETPLLLAASDGHKDVAELLLANKADVNAKDKNGSTPLRVRRGRATRIWSNCCLPTRPMSTPGMRMA